MKDVHVHPWRLVWLASALLLSCSVATAHNNSFMPGDAFFSMVIQEDALDGELTTATYSRLPRYTMFCGYFGYGHAQLVEFSEEQKANIKIAIRHAEQFTDLEKSTDGWLLFVYNKDFNFRKHRIGLRYNENWADVQRGVMAHVVYDELGGPRGDGASGNQSALLLENFRSANVVKALEFEAPPRNREYEARLLEDRRKIWARMMEVRNSSPDGQAPEEAKLDGDAAEGTSQDTADASTHPENNPLEFDPEALPLYGKVTINMKDKRIIMPLTADRIGLAGQKDHLKFVVIDDKAIRYTWVDGEARSSIELPLPDLEETDVLEETGEADREALDSEKPEVDE